MRVVLFSSSSFPPNQYSILNGLSRLALTRIRTYIHAVRSVEKDNDITTTQMEHLFTKHHIACQNVPVSVQLPPTWGPNWAPVQEISILTTTLLALNLEQSLMKQNIEQAPKNLLSLTDYSILQAAVEMIIVWCIYPFLPNGLLKSIKGRYTTKTQHLSMTVRSLAMGGGGGVRSVRA